MHVVIWDLDDTLYHRHVQVDETYAGVYDIKLFSDALPVLMRQDQIDILVSREKRNGMQDKKIDALGIREQFEEIFITETDEEKLDIFRDIKDRYSYPIYVVGDLSSSEIRWGNKLGMTTVLCKRGKYMLRKPKDKYEKPNYTIKDLTELKEIVKRV